MPMPDFPENISEMSIEQRRMWLEQWELSQQLQDYRKAKLDQERSILRYGFSLDQNGTLTIDDVQPGQYRLEIRLYREGASVSAGDKPLVSVDYEFEVPPASDDQEGTGFDIGVIEVEIQE
jgi:hypothetical protein